MKHLGDITKLSGYELPAVDVIVGGSPCQDLSVAGKRAGLAGQRSGLFMEQMRIVKEMRERDVRDFGRTGFLVRPRYMVWENVPGAFSSGNPKGSDFQAVLEEIVRVVCEEAPPVPIPKEGWPKAGCISGVGDSGCTFSIAWRVHDAQFWGVPQRRKRIALVADFGGLSAPEILFERKGLSGDSGPGRTARKETAGATGGGVEGASCYGLDHVMLSGGTTYQGRGYYDNVSACLKTQPHGVCESFSIDKAITTGSNCTAGGDCIHSEYTPALTTDKPHAVCETISFQGGVAIVQGSYIPDVAHALSARHDGSPQPDKGNGANIVAVCVGNGQLNQMSMAESANTMDTMHDQQAVMVPNVAHSLKSKANCDFREDSETYPIQGSVVRRLTPLECERLQGYPDGWTDIGEWVDSNGKKHKDADSPRYKALGNSIALPFWQWLARRIVAQYERDVTMASLFDGIGGFPLVFERCGAKAVWASEIEEFPIAVTKKHFPEEATP